MNNKFFKIPAMLIIAMALPLSLSCSGRPAYIKNSTFTKPNIWEKIEINSSKLSADQKKIFSENGTPSYIFTFFESNAEGKKGKPVQEWVYEKLEKFFWFDDGNLTDYIAVAVPKGKKIQIPGGGPPPKEQ